MPRPDLEAPLVACSRGELAPNMALMRLVMAAETEAEAEHALNTAMAQASDQAMGRLAAAVALWEATPDAFTIVKSMLQMTDRRGGTVAEWAAAFDGAAGLSQEASVALFSLGRRDLLEAASAEIISRLRDWRLLASGGRVLDVGCGIGRLLPALARDADLVVGLDVSPIMLAAARRRCPDCANVVLVRGSGHDLAPFPDQALDLVLAVDVFPYIVEAGPGLAGHHVAEAARVLRPGGSLVIMNYSYRGDEDLDRRDIEELARGNGLAQRVTGRCGFDLWDGLVFHLRRPP